MQRRTASTGQSDGLTERFETLEEEFARDGIRYTVIQEADREFTELCRDPQQVFELPRSLLDLRASDLFYPPPNHIGTAVERVDSAASADTDRLAMGLRGSPAAKRCTLAEL
jgi:hypothetical protein